LVFCIQNLINQDMQNLNHRQIYLFLILIILVGAVLRIYGLSFESLWQDELHTALTVNSSLKESFDIDLHPPLYYILIYSWSKNFGNTDISLRFFSAIFGIISIFLIFLVSRLLFDYRIGLLSSFILAISEFHVYYSQEAKMYSLLTFFVILSIYFFIKLLQKDKLRYVIGYIISTIFCIYTHLYGIFILLVGNVYFLSFIKKRSTKVKVKRWIYIQLFLFIPWVFFSTQKITNFIFINFNRHLPKPDLYLILNTFNNYTVSGSVFFVTLFLLGIGSLIKNEENNKKNIGFVLLWLSLPILVSYIFSFLHFSILYSPRYVIFCSIPYYILIAKGLFNVKWHFLRIFLLTGLIIVSTYSFKNYYTTKCKTDWKSVASYLKQTTKGEEAVLLLDTTWTRESMKRYYDGTAEIILLKYKYDQNLNLVYPYQNLKEDRNFNILIEKLKKYRAFWLIYIEFPYHLPALELYKKSLDRDFNLGSSEPLFKTEKNDKCRYGVCNFPIELYYYTLKPLKEN